MNSTGINGIELGHKLYNQLLEVMAKPDVNKATVYVLLHDGTGDYIVDDYSTLTNSGELFDIMHEFDWSKSRAEIRQELVEFGISIQNKMLGF